VTRGVEVEVGELVGEGGSGVLVKVGSGVRVGRGGATATGVLVAQAKIGSSNRINHKLCLTNLA
jgi:hypothetical protein